MSDAEGTCARTRGWHGEYGGFQRYKSKDSSTDYDISADSDTDKSERWSELQASSTGYASEPSEKEISTLGGFVEGLGGLKVSPKELNVNAMDAESREVDITEEEDLQPENRDDMATDSKIEKNQEEIVQVAPFLDDAKGSRGKRKDSHKRKESERVKVSKKNDKNKDELSEKAKKESKRKQEETGDKKSHKKEKKSEKSLKSERNDDGDSTRRDKHRGTAEKDHFKGSRHDRDDKRFNADTNSDDDHSQRRDRHWDSGKSHQSKSSNKTDREKDSKRTKVDSDQRVTHRGRSPSRSPPRSNNKWHSSSHGKEVGRSPSPRYKEREDREWAGRDKNDKEGSAKFRRFGFSGLGGYSPRRRRSDAAIKTPSPPPRSPERKKSRAWDLPPVGMDSSLVAAMAAAHQAAAAQQAVALASVSSLVTMNPAVTAVTLTQATRPFRRLYVGNVPATVSDGELMEFMNAAMLSANANHLPGTKPCINCLVNVEKNYAFAEFLTPEDATAALAFDGVTLHGTILKIRRPKDYVPPANGGAEVSAVVEMVSNVVVDSPRKVFVGGICSTLSSDKVREIVTAFGQLKAYHWEVATKDNRKESFAFLEYLDPSVTLKACAGLNGMRLGNHILTVFQATPNASSETERTESPFYGIPEQAKTLLQTPTRVLELQNVISEQEILTMSDADLEEVAEDIRLECIRFGTVRSMHIVRPHDEAMRQFFEAARNELSTQMGDAGFENQANVLDQFFQSAVDGNGVQTGADVNIANDNDIQYMASETGSVSNVNGNLGHLSLTEPGAEHLAGQFMECQTVVTAESIPGTVAQQLPETKVADEAVDIGENAQQGSLIQLCLQPEENVPDNAISENFPVVSKVDVASSGNKNFELRESNIGRVYVEFSREEFTCQAAHSLHERMYGDRKVVAGYFPLKLYQKKFRKGLEPQTFEEKQALALAAQERLNSLIKD